MRKLAVVAIGSLLFTQGCSLMLPNGLAGLSGLVRLAGTGAVTADPTPQKDEQACAAAFKQLDADHDGFLSEKEYGVAIAMNSLDPHVVGTGLSFKERDLDGDGKISPAEFLKTAPCVPEVPTIPPVVTPPPMPSPGGTPPAKVDGFACKLVGMELLRRFDRDKNGSLGFDEFAPLYALLTSKRGCGAIAAGEGMLTGNAKYGIAQTAAGNVIVANNGGLVANDAGALIVNNGGGIISNNDGSLVSNNADTLVVHGEVKPADFGPGGCGPDPKLVFMMLDTNHDQQISLAELCTSPLLAGALIPHTPPVPKPVHLPPPPPPLPIRTPAPPPNWQPPSFIPNVGDCKAVFQQWDLNHDGGIDFNEYVGMRTPAPLTRLQITPVASVDGSGRAPLPAPVALMFRQEFDAKDTNHDGKLDQNEWCGSFGAQTPAPMPSAPPIDCNINWPKLDANGDGVVSWDEYYTGMQANTDVVMNKDQIFAEFQAKDANGDGQLDASEWCTPVAAPPSSEPSAAPSADGGQCGAMFDAYDANHDGFVDLDEFANGKWAQELASGTVQPADEATAKAKFKDEARQFDSDGDGQLGLVEFLQACPVYVPGSVAGR